MGKFWHLMVLPGARSKYPQMLPQLESVSFTDISPNKKP